jgi:hypothetical protein
MSADLAIAFTDGSATPPESAPVPATLVVVPAQPGPAPAAAAPAAPATPQQPATTGALPKFEGAQVGMTEIKISGQCAIEVVGDMTVSLDDLVRAVGVYRVIKVNHYVHPKTGETVRLQILKPVETLVVVPFDSSNPNDDGIVHARPVTP